MAEPLRTPETGGFDWSIDTFQYDPTLHVPSHEAINYALRVDEHLPEEARTRVATAGILFEVAELLNPDVSVDKDKVTALHRYISRAVMKASELSSDRIEAIGGHLDEEHTPAIYKILDDIADSLPADVYSLANKTISVLLSQREG